MTSSSRALAATDRCLVATGSIAKLPGFFIPGCTIMNAHREPTRQNVSIELLSSKLTVSSRYWRLRMGMVGNMLVKKTSMQSLIVCRGSRSDCLNVGETGGLLKSNEPSSDR